MAVKRLQGSMNVVEASKQRIRNVFSNGVPVYMAFSAGKDSLCMSYLVYDLILKGEINAKQLTVIFIDEEAIFPSMHDMAMRWRKRFIAVGAEFRWYCLPFRQMNGLHQLENNEEWITWEPGKEDEWVRTPPPFAITRSPYLKYVGQMTYQQFCDKICKGGIQLIGIRVAESVQRLQDISRRKMSMGITREKVIPIYDWKDSDVWLFIKEHNLDFPEAYIDLYRCGEPRRRMRLSQYFSTDCITALLHICETNPELWAKIEKREPNAYLALMYYDSEMFHRNTRKRKELEEGEEKKDYKELLSEMLIKHPEKYFTNNSTKATAKRYRAFFVKNSVMMSDKHFQKMYEALIAGDPKLRSLRALFTTVFSEYNRRED